MRTVEIPVFQFSELSDRAKDRAREWWRNGAEYPWHGDCRASITAFCDHFGVTLRDWSIGAHCPFDYSTDAEPRHFRGMKLRDFSREHMPTGYCLDCDLWMTFYDTFKKTGDAKLAFDDAIHAGFIAWQRDIEWHLSDESVDESIEINGYEFDENGDFFN